MLIRDVERPGMRKRTFHVKIVIIAVAIDAGKVSLRVVEAI